MEVFIQFIHNLQALIEPVRVFVSDRATTTTSSSPTGELGFDFRIFLVGAIKILLWGMDLLRDLLVWLLSVLTA